MPSPRKRKPTAAAQDLAAFAARQIRTNLALLAEVRAVRAMFCKLLARVLASDPLRSVAEESASPQLEAELTKDIDAKITSFMKRLQQEFYEQTEDIDAALAAFLDDRKPEDVEPDS